ncbi:hypothetical protein CK203_104594 [Vitis vinifera]|uniref:Uncharacterized protein n=1 Tax=Vitis vinifera TaxID=29760 RepID=A0A438CAN9_VITVI|nr:hypothetical protein CK203_104594 [Vitis vinifera]
MARLLFTFIIPLFLTPFIFTTPSNAAYNVVSFGAKSGGQTDSTAGLPQSMGGSLPIGHRLHHLRAQGELFGEGSSV